MPIKIVEGSRAIAHPASWAGFRHRQRAASSTGLKQPRRRFFSSPNRFAFYSVKATCIKTTGIKLSIFQLRLQVQVQFIMAKKLLAMRGLDLPTFRSRDQCLTNTPRTRRCDQWCIDEINRKDCMS